MWLVDGMEKMLPYAMEVWRCGARIIFLDVAPIWPT